MSAEEARKLLYLIYETVGAWEEYIVAPNIDAKEARSREYQYSLASLEDYIESLVK